jgi:hypothetical protein
MNNQSVRQSLTASLAAAILMALPLISGVARADTVVPQAVHADTRAEVRADLAVWVASGMQKLDREYDGEADIDSAEYKKDFATYTYLRSSPQFAMLVSDFQHGANTTIAVTQDPLSASLATR